MHHRIAGAWQRKETLQITSFRLAAMTMIKLGQLKITLNQFFDVEIHGFFFTLLK